VAPDLLKSAVASSLVCSTPEQAVRVNLRPDEPPGSHVDFSDQRITQDVYRFCGTFRALLLVLIISPFTVAYYTFLCYQSLGYLGPVCIYTYFIVGAIIDRLILTPIVGVVVKLERLEGDFRFKHMHIRSNAESIAFYRSGELEMKKTNSRLQV